MAQQDHAHDIGQTGIDGAQRAAGDGERPGVSRTFALDEFSNVVPLTRKPCWQRGEVDEFTDQDGTELSGWLGSPDHYRISAKPEMVMGCVEAMAHRRKFHPVQGYLERLVWDGKPRLSKLFHACFSTEATACTQQAAQCFMTSAVASILWVDPQVRHNGAQVHFMLVLEGEQGRGKTSAVRALFGSQWYAEAMESPGNKDFYQSLRGRWSVEIGEMDRFNKADVTKVKQAITARFDTYRPSHGRISRSFRRECVFVGTNNEHEYLRDASGGRRFLPVKVGAVDIPSITRDRDQLWAEAVALFRGGFKWWDLPPDAYGTAGRAIRGGQLARPIPRWLAGRAHDSHYPGGQVPAMASISSGRRRQRSLARLLALISASMANQSRCAWHPSCGACAGRLGVCLSMDTGNDDGCHRRSMGRRAAMCHSSNLDGEHASSIARPARPLPNLCPTSRAARLLGLPDLPDLFAVRAYIALMFGKLAYSLYTYKQVGQVG